MNYGWDDDIHFCPAFFDFEGTELSIDQQTALLLHEFSHFPGSDSFPGPHTDDNYDWKMTADINASLGVAQLYEDIGSNQPTEKFPVEYRLTKLISDALKPTEP